MKKRTAACLRKPLFLLYYLISLVAVPVVYFYAHRYGELKHLSKEDYGIWQRAMLRMLREYCMAGYNFRIRQVIYSFANSKIEVVRKTPLGSPCQPIVVLCVKNDLKRLQMLVEHYRALGVEKFAFLDNVSDDGTYEWLLEQPDVDLFRCQEHYQTAVKEGWINRVVSYYGFNRWYILTDSDELMVYSGMEKHPLSDLTKYAEKSKITRFKGLTLDTYTAGNLFGKSDNIKEDYCWIDTDSYKAIDAEAGQYIYKRFVGGPRLRLMKSTITLSKFPLVYFEPGTISDSAHFQFPHESLSRIACHVGILHYKFIDKDLAEYERRAQKSSGFSSGGKIYRKYMDYIQNAGQAGFMYEGSVEFSDSSVLNLISLIEAVDFVETEK